MNNHPSTRARSGTMKARALIAQGTDNIFFVSLSIVILITVVLGFARSYFLTGVFLAPLPSLLVHFHGAAMSCWILLFVAQAALIAKGGFTF